MGRNPDGTIDVARQTQEMIAYMDGIAKERAERDRLGLPPLDNWNPFPGWAKKIIKDLAAKYRSKARFDDENRTYKIRIKGDRDDFEEFFAEWSTCRDAARPTDPESVKWLDQYEIRAVATGEDENAALFELDAHHSGYPSTQMRGGGPPNQTAQASDKETAARAQAAQS